MRHSSLPQISRTLCLGGMMELEAGNGKKTIQSKPVHKGVADIA